MRPLAAFLIPLLLLPACTTLDSEQETRLAEHQRQAALYFEKQKWGQAMDQIERGLEIDPDDYKLNSMKGGILLIFSGDALGTDHKKLDEATALLATQFEARSLGRHLPHLLLNYARALQKQGLRHLGEAVRLAGTATRTVDPKEAEGMRLKAATEREQADALLQQADELLVELISRGEQKRLAHSHRLQIALQRGDDKTFRSEAEAYFAQSKVDEQGITKSVETTKSGVHEQEQVAMLKALRDEELVVRNVVAQFHYDRKEFNEALADLNRVLEIDPRRFIDYFNRGRVLLELGRTEEAKNDMRRFLADPTIPTTSEKAVFALKVIDK